MDKEIKFKLPGFLLKKSSRIGLAVVVAFAIIYGLFFSAPERFPTNDMVVIPDGVSVKTAGDILKSRQIIRSSAIFTVITDIFAGGSVRSGGYLFDKKQGVFTVSFRVAKGRHNLENIRVTFPEGSTIKDMAATCSKYLPLCKEDEFTSLASKEEGYLFPDTYFFLQSADAKEVIKTMRDTFDQKITALDKEIRLSGKSATEALVMASIIEKEANKFEDQQKVSSVLWKRIALGMPLQVDATLDYALGKNTYQLTKEDLATTSPYNTYKYKGLPPAPISNPGLDAIRAAISPEPTKYLFYLTDKSGRFYFAENFDQHVANKQKYLNHF